MADSRVLALIGSAAGIGLLLYWLAPVLTPFLIAALLAHIANPAVGWLAVRGVPRTAGVLLIFLALALALAGLVVVLVPLIEHQLARFAAKLPGYLDWAGAQLLPRLERYLGALPLPDAQDLKNAVQQHWKELGATAGTLLATLTRSGLGLLGWLLNLVLIPVVTFYLLRDWERVLERAGALLPPRWRRPAIGLARETDAVLGSFLRGQLSVMLLLAVFYSLGLWWIGLDLALPIGILAGLVSFVPYLGFVTGLLAAAIAALLQFQQAGALLWVLAVFGAGQALEGMVLTPHLVGERIGLHPVAVIFAVMAGGQLFGFLGMLLALPLAAVINVLLRFAHERYVASPLYAGAQPSIVLGTGAHRGESSQPGQGQGHG